MSYVERIFIGLILLISAYSFYNNSQERHQFHQAVALLSKTMGKCLGCFPCIEKYRSAFVVLLLTGGVSLVFDFGVTVAILSQLLILAIDASTLRCEFDSDSYRSVLINFVILLILLKNSSCFSCKSKKISNISAQVPSNVAQPKPASQSLAPQEQKAQKANPSKKGSKGRKNQ